MSGYYVSNAGSDLNDGRTTETPWKTIKKVNTRTFVPGDAVYFKAGDVWAEYVPLAPQGSGTQDKPITIGCYHDCGPVTCYDGIAKPKLLGDGRVNEVIRLHNQEYWTIGGLEISNTAAGFTNPASADRGQESLLGDFRGIHITGQDTAALSGITLHHLYIHDVSGWIKWIGGDLAAGWDPSKRTGGIVVESLAPSGAVPTIFRDITVTDNVLLRNSFSAVSVKQWLGDKNWAARDAKAAAPDYHDPNWKPHERITVKNNVIDQDGWYKGNGIYLTSVKDSFVDGNVVAKAGVCGIELYYADKVVIQNNEVYGSKAKAGGGDCNGIDPDRQTTNIIVQFNFVHDCGEGILLCGYDFSTVVVRNNLIANCIPKARPDDPPIYIAEHVDRGAVKVYNNVLYHGTDSAAVPVFRWIGPGNNTSDWEIYDNMFCGAAAAGSGFAQESRKLYRNNACFGGACMTGLAEKSDKLLDLVQKKN